MMELTPLRWPCSWRSPAGRQQRRTGRDECMPAISRSPLVKAPPEYSRDLRRRFMAQHFKFLCFPPCYNEHSSSIQRLSPRRAQNSALEHPFVLRAIHDGCCAGTFAPAPSASVVTPRDCAHPAPIELHLCRPPPLSTSYSHLNTPQLTSLQRISSQRCIPGLTSPVFHGCSSRHTNSSPTRSRCHPYDRSHSTVLHSSRL